MPSWAEILEEINATTVERGPLGPDFDGVREKYLAALHARTGRAVISYASGWLNGKTGFHQTAVTGEDVHGFMQVCHEVEERDLDLIIHSPGGDPQAAEQIVEYLRTQFDSIRCFVPLQAKSAATMIALGCDEILMGHHSELGPIDPQIQIPTADGVRSGPAHGILRDFRRAQTETQQNVTLLPAWTPILRSYVGGMIEYCTQAVSLSMDLVEGWLGRYMLTHPDYNFPDDAARAARAKEIAEYFGSNEAYDRFRAHGRPIRLPELRDTLNLRVTPLGDNDALQDDVLSIFHATAITFNGPATKIIENHLGSKWAKVQQAVMLQIPQPQSG